MHIRVITEDREATLCRAIAKYAPYNIVIETNRGIENVRKLFIERLCGYDETPIETEASVCVAVTDTKSSSIFAIYILGAPEPILPHIYQCICDSAVCDMYVCTSRNEYIPTDTYMSLPAKYNFLAQQMCIHNVDDELLLALKHACALKNPLKGKVAAECAIELAKSSGVSTSVVGAALQHKLLNLLSTHMKSVEIDPIHPNTVWLNLTSVPDVAVAYNFSEHKVAACVKEVHEMLNCENLPNLDKLVEWCMSENTSGDRIRDCQFAGNHCIHIIYKREGIDSGVSKLSLE